MSSSTLCNNNGARNILRSTDLRTSAAFFVAQLSLKSARNRQRSHFLSYWRCPPTVTRSLSEHRITDLSQKRRVCFFCTSTMSSKTISWWDQLSTAILESNSDKGYSYAQLSTIRGPKSGRLSGRPAVRTVNIRSVKDRRLYFVTDLRSGKADDIAAGPTRFAELAWFFPKCNKQFRLSGSLFLRSGDELARNVWADLHEGQRRWWAWPAPAEKRAPQSAFDAPVPEDPPAHFCVGELLSDHVDVVDLSVMPYMREMHNLTEEGGKNDWKTELVNP